MHSMGLDTVELVIRVEKEFDIEIPNADAARLVTVGDLQAYVVGVLRRQGQIESADSVDARLRDIICDQLGVEPDDVVPSARFVDDLGAD
jgi:acyl carrier protein